MERFAGASLIVGTLLFMIAAFTPLTYRVVTAGVQQRMELIQTERLGWVILNVLFGIGSVVVVAGLALFAWQIQNLTQNLVDNTIIRLASYLSLVTAILSGLLWVSICYNRIVTSPEELSSTLSINNWVFPAYTLLSQITLLIVGFVLIQSGYPDWLGWGILVLGGLSVVAYLVFKDMPPFAHYVPLLVMGIALVR